jgi:hypothetical protein
MTTTEECVSLAQIAFRKLADADDALEDFIVTGNDQWNRYINGRQMPDTAQKRRLPAVGFLGIGALIAERERRKAQTPVAKLNDSRLTEAARTKVDEARQAVEVLLETAPPDGPGGEIWSELLSGIRAARVSSSLGRFEQDIADGSSKPSIESATRAIRASADIIRSSIARLQRLD